MATKLTKTWAPSLKHHIQLAIRAARLVHAVTRASPFAIAAIAALLALPLAAAQALPNQDVTRDGGLESPVADCSTTPTAACSADPDLRFDGEGFRLWFNAGLAPGQGLGGSNAVDLGLAGTPNAVQVHGHVAVYLQSAVALGDLEGTHLHYQTASSAYANLSLYLRADLQGTGAFDDCLIGGATIVADGNWNEANTTLDSFWSVGYANGCAPSDPLPPLPLAAIRSAFPNALVKSLHVQTIAAAPVAAGNGFLVDDVEVLAGATKTLDPVRTYLAPQNALRTDAGTVVHPLGGAYGFDVATDGARVCDWRAEFIGLPHSGQSGTEQVVLSIGSAPAAGGSLDLARPAVSPCSDSAYFSVPQGAIQNAQGNMGHFLLRYTFTDPDGGEHSAFYSEAASDLRGISPAAHSGLLALPTPLILARGNVAVFGTLPEADLTLDQATSGAGDFLAGLSDFLDATTAPFLGLLKPVTDCVENQVCPEPPVNETALDPVLAALQPVTDCVENQVCPDLPVNETALDPVLAALQPVTD